MTAAVNSWILFQQIHKKQIPLSVLVSLGEEITKNGREKAGKMVNVGDHLPSKGISRRR